ncbi:hypothetical protein NQZ68_002613, partial [Dissostichus eleginoides]
MPLLAVSEGLTNPLRQLHLHLALRCLRTDRKRPTLKTADSLVGETFGGGEIACRSTLTSEQLGETDKDGPFYLRGFK